tara:strand:- start:123 stop:386 length:264 start_codon:yes stop_codon:yes gene_type:complete
MPYGKGTYGSQVGRPRTNKMMRQKGGAACSLKVKGVDVCALTKRQQTTLQEHATHHTKKHIQEMVNSMKGGASFSQAHKQAMSKVGK